MFTNINVLWMIYLHFYFKIALTYYLRCASLHSNILDATLFHLIVQFILYILFIHLWPAY